MDVGVIDQLNEFAAEAAIGTLILNFRSSSKSAGVPAAMSERPQNEDLRGSGGGCGSVNKQCAGLESHAG